MNKCISKGHVAERMRVKKDKLKSFVIQKEIAVQKTEFKKKRDQENQRSNIKRK